jgi:release factor glutamine methyltransferase
MRALEKLKETTEFLKRYGIEDAGREAEIILAHCLGIDRTAFYRDDPIISRDEHEKFEELLKRRSKKEPLQYILGYVDFYGLKIKVGKGVLIPRPETELLVEEAIKIVSHMAFDSQQSAVSSQESNSPLPTDNPPSPPFAKGGSGGITNSSLVTHHSLLFILDLCTGSGCLALAIAREFPDIQVYGTDISEFAIRYAKENAKLNCISNVIFLQGNLFEPLEKLFTLHSSLFTFNLIISNPPYIKKKDIKNLQPEIKDWEPIDALDGGEDGLDYYRAVIPKARDYLKEGGHLMLELGVSQADAVREISKNAGFIDISLIKDYAGIERILILKSGG